MTDAIRLPTSGIRPGKLINPEHRLATATFSTGAKITKHGEMHTLSLEGCDLAALRQAPLLVQHSRHADDLIGVVEEAWIEHAAVAVVRFARHDRAEHFWSMLQDGMPLSVSVGYDIVECEQAPDHTDELPSYHVLSWRPTELSIVAFGADRGASMKPVSLGALIQRDHQRAVRIEQERAERLERLRAPAWRAWATETAATSLAAELDVPTPWISSRMSRLVDQHLAQLENAERVIAEARAEV